MRESYAGQIDLVCQDENGHYHLWDFKTGGHETVDYQLSLYKRAFCKNRGIDPEIVHLHCIDAKNEEKIKVFDVRTIAKEWLDKLLHCYANGELYEEPAMELVGMPVTTLQKLEALENYYIALDAEMKALDAEKNALREDLYKAMQKEKMKNFSFGSIKAASVAPQIKESFNLEGCKQKYNEQSAPCILWDYYYKEVITSVFDEELFKKEHPKEYAEFLRTEQKVKGYLKMTVNDLTEAK